MDIRYEESLIKEKIFSGIVPKHDKFSKTIMYEQLNDNGINVDGKEIEFEYDSQTKEFVVYSIKKVMKPYKIEKEKICARFRFVSVYILWYT